MAICSPVCSTGCRRERGSKQLPDNLRRARATMAGQRVFVVVVDERDKQPRRNCVRAGPSSRILAVRTVAYFASKSIRAAGTRQRGPLRLPLRPARRTHGRLNVVSKRPVIDFLERNVVCGFGRRTKDITRCVATCHVNSVSRCDLLRWLPNAHRIRDSSVLVIKHYSPQAFVNQ